MVHLTLAIADFMTILITSALWAAASIGGVVVIAIVALGLILWFARKIILRAISGRDDG